MTAVCTALSVLILVRIAKREGRAEDLKRFFARSDDPREKAFTAPLIVACVILVLVTLVMLVAARLLIAYYTPGAVA